MKTFLSKIHPVNDSVLEEYISHWSEYSIPKKHIMTAAGETERFIYFVQEGIQKSYYLNEGKEHVIAFAYPPSFSGVPESFFTQTPSKYFLETITASKFLRLSYQKHQQLMEEHREIETLFRKTTEHFLMGVIQRHHELMAFDMETRFRLFAKRSPHLLNMITQKDIASYLRIDATNFSKLINSIQI
jgi:CRP-like cAMP-binding protein